MTDVKNNNTDAVAGDKKEEQPVEKKVCKSSKSERFDPQNVMQKVIESVLIPDLNSLS